MQRPAKILQRLLNATLVVLVFGYLLAGPPVCAETRTIRVIHVNDFHGFAEPYRAGKGSEKLGGIAWLSRRVNELRLEKPSLLLAAGDMIAGNTWANLFQGRSVIELMNAMRFDAMVVGNHEFDFGPEALRQRIGDASFPVLGANVSGLEGLRPFVVKEVGGVKIGIIGIVTEETPIMTSPRNVTGIRFLSAEKTVKMLVDDLRKQTDLIVVLSHLGFPEDRELARLAEGPLLIVGGHTHTNVQTPADVNGNVVVQAWEHGKAIGVVDIELEDGRIKGVSGRTEEIRPKGEPDRVIERIVAKYDRLVDDELNETVGSTSVDLDAAHVRSRETNLGNLIADIVRETAGAEAAVVAGGGIRTSVPKGKITKKLLYSVAPFDNRVVSFRMTGRQIRAALEHGLSFMGEASPKFPQVSGIRFTYRRFADGKAKVVELRINDAPVEDEREYLVATDDFLAAGGDGYTMFREAASSVGNKGPEGFFYRSGAWLRDLIAEYIRAKKRISPSVEGRSVRID